MRVMRSPYEHWLSKISRDVRSVVAGSLKLRLFCTTTKVLTKPDCLLRASTASVLSGQDNL